MPEIEAIIETDELPIIGAPADAAPVVEPVVEPIVDTPPAPATAAEPAPAPVVEPLPENLETDKDLPFFKKEEEPVVEPVVEPVKEELEDLFSADLFETPAEPVVEEPVVEEEAFVTEFFTEAGDLFGDKKVNTTKELVDLVKNTIENSKTLIAIDTSKYTKEQIALHEHLASEKSINEFVDIAAPYLNFMSNTDDQKVRTYLIHEKGIPENEVQEEVNRLIEADEWDDTVEIINTAILQLKDDAIASRVEQIKNDSLALTTRASTIAQQEQTEMITVLDGMEEFMGIKLPDTFKAQLKSEITSGMLTKKNNNAQTQVKARLYDLVGERIQKQQDAQRQLERDQAYNRGLETGQGILYNKPPRIESPGHMKPNESKDEKAGFRNIDSDAIDTNT